MLPHASAHLVKERNLNSISRCNLSKTSRIFVGYAKFHKQFSKNTYTD